MSQGRLLVALYQRLLRDVVGAETAISEHRIEGAHLQLVHAQEIIEALDHALDPAAWAEAENLREIYTFLRQELIRANITKDARVVAQCRRVIEPLLHTWQDALAQTGQPVTGLVPPLPQVSLQDAS